MRYFTFIVLLLTAFSLAAQQPAENRRHYRPSRSFLENSDENCFEATRKEADRAFAQRCWDDASLLYRAAKNCADADQKRRQEMSDRLDACRTAAELELVNRERHAIAANRADDSHELLRLADRSLAFRMADFANNYIAPPGDDNPDCQQAMFDAWYASPGALGGEYADSIQAPFCYQLGENLGAEIIVRFAGKGAQKKIYAFSNLRHLLYSWDAQTLEAGEPQEVDPGVYGFEVAPDGNTFLFYSQTLLIFWRKGRELYRLNVPRMHDFCFDGKSDEFFLLDTVEMKIEALSLREVYLTGNNKMQKQRKIEELRIPPTFRAWMTGVGPELLDFAVSEGDTWLGYRDSILVVRKPQAGQGWEIVKNYRIPRPVSNGMFTPFPLLHLVPDRNLAFYGNDTSSMSVLLSPDGNMPVSEVHLSGYPLALPSQNGYSANLKSESYLHAGAIQIFNERGGMEYAGAVQELEYYGLMSGAMDQDGEWLVLPSGAGVLNCWRLENSRQNIFHKFKMGEQYVADISPDGRSYISHTMGLLNICDCIRPGELMGSPMQIGADSSLGFFNNKMSNHWVASPWRFDSTLVWNWETGKRWIFPFQSSPDWPVAFTEDERYLAAAHPDGQIRVYDLSNGNIASTRPYSGQIQEMTFVPGSNELVLLQISTSDYDYSQKRVVRIIQPFRNDYRQRMVRLHEYEIALMTVSAQGDYLALSNGLDVRIFDLDNLTDEIAQIMPSGEGLGPGTTALVLAIQFTPDGRSLVATYGDQSVIFWNIETGQANFKLRLPAEASYMSFTKIRMIPDGNLLCLLSPGDGLLIRSLDPAAIRAAIQPPNHQLIAFSADQISKYNLDQALNYPGNFEQLAGSGDIPLIKSFLNYYFRQAVSSSNIDRVSEYCDRAFVLYSQLDMTTQRESKQSVVDMYENYLWKWLIRDRPDKAEQVLQYVNRQFARPRSSILSEAHIALVKGKDEDLRRAMRLYVDWITQETGMLDADIYLEPSLRPIFDKFVQLAEFELIGEKQIDYLCGMFGDWPNFTLCSNRAKNAAAVPFDPETRLRWEIYKKIYLNTQTERYAQRLILLQSAQEDARQLSKTKPALGRPSLEKVMRQMGVIYLNWAVFEQGNDRTPLLCRQGITLLENAGPFQQQEQQRLETLAFLYQELTADLYNKDQFEEALETCKKGYGISERLWNMTTDTSELRGYADGLVGNQLTLLGNISLMMGDLATARVAFEEANNMMTQGLNTYFVAHVDLAEGNEIAALLNYGGIFTTEALGNAVFDLERLANRMPARKDSILAFIPRMRTAWLANHLRSSSVEVDYRYAALQTQRAVFLKNYKQALEWNTRVLEYVEELIRNKNTTETWGDFRADAQLNQSYYMIMNSLTDTSMLTGAIDLAYTAEKEALAEGEGSFMHRSDEFLRTNIGHGHLLRNRPGDREQAIVAYRDFLAMDGARTGTYWDVLQKDFRDLHALGFKWPDLKSVIEQIKPPYITLSGEEWQEMGVDVR